MRGWLLIGRITLPGLALGGALAAGGQGAAGTFTIDPVRSRVLVHVGKSGLFSFAGHTHEVAAPVRAGRVVYDAGDPARSSVVVEFDAAALRVTGRGEPAEDVPEVQRTMLGPRVLDVERFPRIAFESRRISVTAASGDRLSLRIAGDLTLHGVTRPAAAVVEVQVGAEELAARGRLTVKQTDFGIRPVTAGAGTVRVKDALDIEFSLIARRQGSAGLGTGSRLQAADVRPDHASTRMPRVASRVSRVRPVACSP